MRLAFDGPGSVVQFPGEWALQCDAPEVPTQLFNIMARAHMLGRGGEWVRFQRMVLDSLSLEAGGHGFGNWWERYHETHPEYFALQPDGTRSGFSGPIGQTGTIKPLPPSYFPSQANPTSGSWPNERGIPTPYPKPPRRPGCAGRHVSRLVVD